MVSSGFCNLYVTAFHILLKQVLLETDSMFMEVDYELNVDG